MAQGELPLPVTFKRHGKALVPACFWGLVGAVLMVSCFLLWPSSWPYQWVLQALMVVAIFIIFALPLLRWNAETFTVTATSVRNDWGVLYRQSREIDLTRIASISEERGILDRIFSCGTLNFYDAAASSQPSTGGSWNQGGGRVAGVRFHDVPRVKEVRELVEEAKQAALSR